MGERIIQTPLELLELQRECIARVKEYVELARVKCGVTMATPQVRFGIQGKTGGRAYWPQNIIQFNPTLLMENPDHFVKHVSGHEVAHLVAHWLNKYKDIDPHGREWRNVMWRFGLPAERCHNYDTSNVPTQMTSVRRPAPIVRNANGLTKQSGGSIVTVFD